jgi:pimeloyl-ACP methyl ester carboxylesterase
MSEDVWTPPLPELDGVTHRRVDVGEVSLHVAEAGPEDAPPLLLVHGWPQSWWCWRKIVPLLGDRYRLVMPDLRGHGWSDAPPTGYEKERLARDLVGVLDALEIERAGYVGHDWGAYCGFLACFAAPERWSAFLGMGIPHPWPSRHDRLNPWRLTAFGYQLPLATVGRTMMRRRLTTRVLKAASSGDPFDARDIAIYESTMGSERGAATSVAMYRTFLLHEVLPLVRGRYSQSRLEIPARLVVGDGDLIVRGADLLGHEENAPLLEVERLPGARHFIPEERPELVADRVQSLFDGAG